MNWTTTFAEIIKLKRNLCKGSIRAQTDRCTAIKIMHNRKKICQLQQSLNKLITDGGKKQDKGHWLILKWKSKT